MRSSQENVYYDLKLSLRFAISCPSIALHFDQIFSLKREKKSAFTQPDVEIDEYISQLYRIMTQNDNRVISRRAAKVQRRECVSCYFVARVTCAVTRYDRIETRPNVERVRAAPPILSPIVTNAR